MLKGCILLLSSRTLVGVQQPLPHCTCIVQNFSSILFLRSVKILLLYGITGDDPDCADELASLSS